MPKSYHGLIMGKQDSVTNKWAKLIGKLMFDLDHDVPNFDGYFYLRELVKTS